MGDKLIRQALDFVLPTHDRDTLTPAARVVLLRMCRQAMDSDAAPVYFAGWEPLALALGYGAVPTLDQSQDDPDLRRLRDRAEKAVGRTLRELQGAALVRQDPRFPRSHNRRWLLCLPTLGGSRPG